jgi:Group II intron, maturase-specific domain
VRARGQRHLTFLTRRPARKAMQHARDRIRALTARERLRVPVEQVVQEVNRFLRGWAGYFRYGNSTRQFDKIRSMRSGGWRCLWPSGTSDRAGTAGGWWCTPPQTSWA